MYPVLGSLISFSSEPRIAWLALVNVSGFLRMQNRRIKTLPAVPACPIVAVAR
jgi:hypothetical protein